MKKNHNELLFFCALLTIVPHSFPEETVKNFYKIINDNSQNTYIQKSDQCCETKMGSDFVSCMHSLPIEDQKEVFKQLTPARRRDYISNLSYEQYETFLKAYSEHDWQDLYNSLSKDEQRHWPKTVKEQYFAVVSMKFAAEKDNDRMNLLVLAVGLGLSPIPYLAYYGYAWYKWFEDGTRIIVDAKIKKYFENYMQSTFEI